MRVLKQSTAYNLTVLMVDSTDHVTGKTGLTLTITASKDGAAFASITPTVTELATGWYKLALTSSHTDTVGDLALHITATGADATDVAMVVRARVTDDLAYPATSGRSLAVDASGQITVGGYASGQAPLQPTVAGRTLDVSAGGEAGIDWANVGSPTTTLGLTGTTISTTQAVASVSGAVGSVTAAVTAGTVSDKTGYSLTAAYDSAKTASQLDAAGVRTAIGLASANLDTQIGTLATASALSTVSGYIDTEVAAIKAKTDNLPASPAATGDIPSAATVASQVRTELTTELGRIDASISSRLASASYTAPLDAAGVRSAVGLASANLDTQLDTLPTAAENASAVWNETLSGHLTAGSTGAALNAAGSAGDPWSTSLPGSYGAGTAGKIVGDNLNATVSSRLASASYTAPLDAAGTRSAIGLASANLDTQLDTLPTAAETATAVRSELTTELGRIDASVSSRLAAASYTAPLDAAGVRSAVGLASANLDTQIDALPTAAETATAVRSELTTELGRLDVAVSSRGTGTALDASGVRSAVGLATANLDTQLDALPTASENASAVRTNLTTELGRLDAAVSTRLASASYTAPLDAAGTRSAVGLASANLDTQLDALPTTAELTTALAGADDAVLAAIAALNNLSSAGAQAAAAAALSAYGAATGAQVGAVLTTQMTESYSVDGSAPTAAQALYAVLQRLTEFSITDSTITVKRLDGSTTAFTLTLDDASAPTSSTRSA